VATLASNCKELVETIFAILTIGALLVPLNIRLSPRELSYVLDHGDVSTLIFLTGFEEIAQKVQPMVSRIERFLAMGGNPPPGFVDFDAITAQQGKEEPPGEVEEEDVAMILYTAGTTGKPKGVVLTHKSWLWSAMNGTTSFRVRPGMKTLTVYPFFHAAGFFNLFISVFNAAPLVTLQKFDPDRFLKIMEREKVNRVANPPTIYNRILQVPDIGRYDLSSVRYLMSGAEVMPDETRNQLKKIFPGAGIYDNYGLTETCSFLTSRSEEYTESKPFSVGIPAISVELRVVDDHGRDVPPGAVGEIIARGPNVMKEYYKDPSRTAEALQHSWLYTQDLGRFDEDRFLYIIERKHNMIISGGENIYPKEVEDVLYRHPKILEAAVYGTLDKTWGQRVHAAVVLKPGEKMTAEEFFEYCREELGSYKRPKSVDFMKALPRNPAGKVLRYQLQDKHGSSS
jgi:acyl-CoA synthetase (AMP-forming)/AMP-acid ligase II